MSSKGTLTWTDWRGKEQVREVNHTLDIRDFKGTIGYPWLVMAANPHLSASEIQRWLSCIGPEYERGDSWIKKRRKLFVPVGRAFPHSPTNRDGKDAWAFKIMREYPSTSSIRFLVRVLEEHGIKRNKNWVRINRVRARAGTV